VEQKGIRKAQIKCEKPFRDITRENRVRIRQEQAWKRTLKFRVINV